MSWLRGRCFTKLLQERAGKWDRRSFWGLLGTAGFKSEKILKNTNSDLLFSLQPSPTCCATEGLVLSWVQGPHQLLT